MLHHNKYTNLYVSRELFTYSTREKLMYYYKETSNLILSFIDLSFSYNTKKKIYELSLDYYIITNKLEIKVYSGNFLNVIKEINFAVYSFVNSDEENLNFLNLNYNFIFYNTNTGIIGIINNIIEIFI